MTMVVSGMMTAYVMSTYRICVDNNIKWEQGAF